MGERGWKQTWKAMRRSWQAYLLLVPIFTLLVLFVYYPPLLGLYRAFYAWSPGSQPAFVGLQNFQNYFTYPETPTELINLAKLLLVGLVVNVGVPFVMAEAIFAVRERGLRDIYRLLITLPMLMPGIVTILLWKNIYDPNLGPINTFLSSIGLGALTHDWLGEPATALYAVVGVGFPWVGSIATLIYLGGLGQISESVFDACPLDGCRGVNRVLRVDLPLVLRQVRLLTILAVIGATTSFENILVMTNGGPGFATTVPSLTMYNRAFGTGQFGYASAIGLLLFIVTLSGTFVINRYMRPPDEA